MKVKDVMKDYNAKKNKIKTTLITDDDSFLEAILDFAKYLEMDVGAEKKHNNNNKAGRPPLLRKWIENNCDQDDAFNLSNYYKNFPQHKQYNDKFLKEIDEMVEEKMLEKLDDERYKVNKI